MPDDSLRPYEDGFGADGMLRYKWRGQNPNLADNRWLRDARRSGVPHLSGPSWAHKRTEIEKHSVLHLNRRILEMGADWDEDAIADRARQLAERAAVVWPR